MNERATSETLTEAQIDWVYTNALGPDSHRLTDRC